MKKRRNVKTAVQRPFIGEWEKPYFEPFVSISKISCK